MTRCAISLGGNVGDVPVRLAEALARLAALPTVSDVRTSHTYRTVPMGVQAGSTFWNAVAAFEATCSPEKLLDELQQIESACGRVRDVRWGPRTLDLDLILVGDQVIESPRLTVPHPALWHRRFVLDPLLELLPDAVHPTFRLSIRDLRERLLHRPLPVGWAVPTGCAALKELVGTAHPTKNVGDGALSTAAIIFGTSDVCISLPQVVRLPDDDGAARQLVTDVLTAALDEPVCVPD